MRKRERGKLEAVGPLLGHALQGIGLDRRLREFRAVERWSAVVGDVIAENTRAVGIRDGVLFVEVASSVWMQELVLLRGDIAERMNRDLGEAIVRRLVFTAERDASPHGEEKE